jgi:hypothetical protein
MVGKQVETYCDLVILIGFKIMTCINIIYIIGFNGTRPKKMIATLVHGVHTNIGHLAPSYPEKGCTINFK